MTETPVPAWLTEQEAAMVADVPLSAVRHACTSGLLLARKRSGTRVILFESLVKADAGPPWVPRPTAADRLGVSVYAVHQLVSAGQLRALAHHTPVGQSAYVFSEDVSRLRFQRRWNDFSWTADR